jgi:hypothetical protein
LELVALKAAIEQVQQEYAFSERRACRLMTMAVTTYRYRSRRTDEPLRTKLVELAREKPRFGYRRLLAMQSDQQSIMNSLKDEGPKAWLAYLRPFEDGQPLTGLSMQVVFNYAAPLAKDQDSLDWAEVAIRAADLEAFNGSQTEREHAMLRAMRLRSWFIAKMGSRPKHRVLDKEVILHWVMEVLNISVQTAEEKAALIWKGVAIVQGSSSPENRQRVHDDLRQLRRIKNRLNVAKMLADCGELPNDPTLNEWLKIREQLP